MDTRHRRAWACFAACVWGACFSSVAAKPFAVHGTMVAVDRGTHDVWVRDDKRRTSFKIYLAPEQAIHRYSPGRTDDLQPGAHVKVYGRVDLEARRIDDVTRIEIMPEKSTYRRSNRIDGILEKHEETVFLRHRGDRVTMHIVPDLTVHYVTAATFADLEPGMETTVVLEEQRGIHYPRNELRIHGPRPEQSMEASKTRPSPQPAGHLVQMPGGARGPLSAYADLQRSGKSGFPLVDGPVQATIVYPDNATVTPVHPKRRYARIETGHAYRELVHWVYRVTGRRLDVRSEQDFRQDEHPYPLFVGDCVAVQRELGDTLAGMDREGFVIRIESDRAFIAGPYHMGTWFGVCDVIERFLGVRWLMPGPLGEDFQSRETVVLPADTIVEEPGIPARQWSGWYQLGPAARQWQFRQRVMMNSWGHRYRFHHSLYKIFPVDTTFDEHPEYYSMQDGRRSRPERSKAGWQVCMANPETVSVAADHARRFFEDNPEKDACGFGVNDSGGYCDCPHCLAMMPTVHQSDFMNPRDYKYSTMFFSWLGHVGKELADSHPDKLLGCLAYAGNTPPPPRHVPIARNILPYLCVTISDMYRDSYHNACRQLIEQWGDRVDQIALYDYAHSMGNVFPRMYMHLNQEVLKHALQHGLKSVYAEAAPIFGLDAPRFYLTARLWWNPDLDVDATLADWSRRMFGDAAIPMQRYFERCESAWMEYDGFWARQNTPYQYHRFWRTPTLEVYTPEVIAECTRMLDDAADRATTDLSAKRVALFRRHWDAGVSYAESYHPVAALAQAIQNDAPLEEAARALAETPNDPTERELLEQHTAIAGDDDLDYYVRKPKSWWLPTPGVRLGWRTCLTPDATTGAFKTLPWFAERLTNSVIPKTTPGTPAAILRQHIHAHLNRVFPGNGSDTYLAALEGLRMMTAKMVTARRTTSPPTIDGTLEDQAWKEAQRLGGFTCIGSNLVPSEYAVSARMTWDPEMLYVAFDCPRHKQDDRIPDIHGNIDMPTVWTAFGPYGPFAEEADRHPLPPVDVLATVPQQLQVGNMRREATRIETQNHIADLETVYPGKAIGLTYYVYIPFSTDTAGDVTFGMGADWWMQVWVDGDTVFDNTTSMDGNRYWPPAIDNHLCTVPVEAGNHVMTIRFLRGKGSAKLAVGPPAALRQIPDTEWRPHAPPFTIMPQPGRRDGGVHLGDYVGIALRSTGTPPRDALILVNPEGVVRDEVDGRLDRDLACRVAVRQRPDRWTIELGIPLGELDIYPDEQGLIRMNLLHAVAGWHLATWYPEPARGAHVDPANMGWVLLRN